MCGIAGILNFDSSLVQQSKIKAMTDSISHRGPDGEGCYLDSNLGLGHRRLKIIDLSEAGKQPMLSANQRFIISYNGELYNYLELKQQLIKLGYSFKSKTDTEVILNAYIEWGANCLNKFNGMFAFAIWDKAERNLFLARDRYGIKPLYYYKSDNSFVFGSEIKAIIASGVYKTHLDKEGLLEYLTFQNFLSDKTLFKELNILKPGHYILLNQSSKIEYQQYWDFDFTKTDQTITKQDAIAEIDRLFTQAVTRNLVSDVPVNSYLSGGIDSGATTIIASQNLHEMKTFTIGFDLSSASGIELSFDERSVAEHISYLAKTEHYEMVLKAGDMERCMPKFTYHLEEPRVGQSYPNYYAAKLASKFGKVVLSGVGGDELFGGYPWRYYYSDKKTCSFDEFIDNYYVKWHRLVPNSSLKQLLSPIWSDVQHIQTKDIFRNIFNNYNNSILTQDDCINYSLYKEAKSFLHGLLVVEDKLSMAHGLESRVPFLDNDLVDFAQIIPNSLKIKESPCEINENYLQSKKDYRKNNGKYILRKTLLKHLDEFVANRPKQGFSSPDASWFKGESIDFVNTIRKDSLLVKENIFDETFLNNYIDEHNSGEKNHRLFIWSFINLETTLRQYFYGN